MDALCRANTTSFAKSGIFSPEYEQCLYEINKQFVTATAIGSMVACLLMGLVADLPIALAPGMGMNAYFTYSVSISSLTPSRDVSFQLMILIHMYHQTLI